MNETHAEFGSEHPGVEDVFLYARGDLKGEERSVLERHAETCPACRARLETVRWIRDQVQAWGRALFQDHPSSERVTRFAEGETLSDPQRHELDRHLAVCEACEEDLRLLASVNASLSRPEIGTIAGDARLLALPEERTASRWWGAPVWAMAAVIALAVPAVFGVLSWIGGDAPDIRALPRTVMLASGEERAAGDVQDVRIPESGSLILGCEVPVLGDGSAGYSGRLVDGEGNMLWESDNLTSVDTFGTFLLEVPAGTLHPGPHRWIIEERTKAGDTQIFEFGFRLIR